jgi:serine/threonine protein kinase
MLIPNTVIHNRYQILQLIGQGGMGAVYEAIDQRLSSHVALKQTILKGEQVDRAFNREAKLLANLRHPALPAVSDFFVEPEGQFLVMQFIPGDDLARLLTQRSGPFPLNDVLSWADQLLDLLDYLHNHQPPIIHRDIKPENIKLTLRGEIILLDFGLAKGTALEQSHLSGGESLFGYTPNYAPIEQIQGIGTNPRSDLYALAATLHYLLTGNKPIDALHRASAVLNRQPDPQLPAHEINPLVPEAVGRLLSQAMALGIDERPDSAMTMRVSLRQAVGQSPVLSAEYPRSGPSATLLVDSTQPSPKLVEDERSATSQLSSSVQFAETRPFGQSNDQKQKDINVYSPVIGDQTRRTTQRIPSWWNWQIWSWWVLAHTTGWAIGRTAGWFAGSITYQIGNVDLGGGVSLFAAGLALTVDTIVVGASISFVQWLLLRRARVYVNWWITGSVIAWIIGGSIGRISGGVLGGAIIGAIVGVAQWVVLRSSIRYTGWWILANIIGYALLWSISGVAQTIVYSAMGGSMNDIIYLRGLGWSIVMLQVGALVGTLFGAITGVEFVRLVHAIRQKPI